MITAVKSANRIANLPPAQPKIGYDMIHLADHEWGNSIMEEVARQWFADHSDCQFVEVREHAGWFLCWRRDMTCWGTANDMANIKPGPTPTGGLNRVCRRETGVIQDYREWRNT